VLLCACLHDARKCFRKVEDENNLSTIIDELGALKAEIADLPAREKSMKEALGDLEAGSYEGERYRISISVSDRDTLDMTAVREHLSRQFIPGHTKTTRSAPIVCPPAKPRKEPPMKRLMIAVAILAAAGTARANDKDDMVAGALTLSYHATVCEKATPEDALAILHAALKHSGEHVSEEEVRNAAKKKMAEIESIGAPTWCAVINARMAKIATATVIANSAKAERKDNSAKDCAGLEGEDAAECQGKGRKAYDKMMRGIHKQMKQGTLCGNDYYGDEYCKKGKHQ
jgi:hypothetical protein